MAFPTHPVSFLDLIICIFRLQIYVFLLGSPFGFFSFPFLFYHHSSFSIAELQCILKLGSYLFLILLFLDSSVFPDDDFLFFFFFPHIYLSTTFSPWTLHSFSSVEIHLPHASFCALLWYFWFPEEVVLHLIPHFLGTEDKRVNKGEKGVRETCSF